MSPRGERTLGLMQWGGNGKRQEESGENGGDARVCERPGRGPLRLQALGRSQALPRVLGDTIGDTIGPEQHDIV